MQLESTPSFYFALELRADGAGLEGSLVDESGTEHTFSGWLGLLTLLEGARLRLEPRAEGNA